MYMNMIYTDCCVAEPIFIFIILFAFAHSTLFCCLPLYDFFSFSFVSAILGEKFIEKFCKPLNFRHILTYIYQKILSSSATAVASPLFQWYINQLWFFFLHWPIKKNSCQCVIRDNFPLTERLYRFDESRKREFFVRPAAQKTKK